MKDSDHFNFVKQRIAYWLSLSMLPSAAVVGITAVLYFKPEKPAVYEMPVIMVGCDGKSTVLWNSGDHANIKASIERRSVEIANAVFANPRESKNDISMTAAKVQRGAGNFLTGSPGERVYLSFGKDAKEKAKTIETTFKPHNVPVPAAGQQFACGFQPTFADVQFDFEAKDWSAIVRGVQVSTLENGTQQSANIVMELLFKPTDAKQRSEKGEAVIAYNMRVTYEK